MNSKLIEMYAYMTARLTVARDEKGQGTLEYVGIVIVAAILVIAVVDAVTDADIKGKIGEEIQKILDKSA
jgi:Flp pilus assembly pilin Flp